MTAEEWDTCGHAMTMLDALEARGGQHQLRGFACACCRRLSHILPKESRDALAVAEAYADGKASDSDLQAACDKAKAGRRRISENSGFGKRKIRTSGRVALAVELAASPDAWQAAREAILLYVDLFGKQQTDLLRQYVRNPYLATNS